MDWSEKVVLCIWSGMQVVMGNGTNINILNIFCPEKRDIWLKLLDEAGKASVES